MLARISRRSIREQWLLTYVLWRVWLLEAIKLVWMRRNYTDGGDPLAD